MSKELKPINCGCGGEAIVAPYHGDGYESFYVYCQNCNIDSDYYETEAEAVTAWNTAMGERTAKVIEHDASITVDGYKYHRSEYLCSACKKKVIGGDEYCSHCGARLEWE